MTETKSISAYGPARSSVSGNPLKPAELQRTQRYWARHAVSVSVHDLSAGQSAAARSL